MSPTVIPDMRSFDLNGLVVYADETEGKLELEIGGYKMSVSRESTVIRDPIRFILNCLKCEGNYNTHVSIQDTFINLTFIFEHGDFHYSFTQTAS